MLTTVKNHTIGQHTLVSILNQRQHVETLKRQYEEARASLQAQEDQIIACLEDSYGVAPGQRVASVKVTERRVVAWKEEFVKRLSKPVADRVQAEVEPTVYKKLEIA